MITWYLLIPILHFSWKISVWKITIPLQSLNLYVIRFNSQTNRKITTELKLITMKFLSEKSIELITKLFSPSESFRNRRRFVANIFYQFTSHFSRLLCLFKSLLWFLDSQCNSIITNTVTFLLLSLFFFSLMPCNKYRKLFYVNVKKLPKKRFSNYLVTFRFQSATKYFL